MIIGLDHITLSSNNVDESTSFLEKLGFKVKFIERDLTNHESKKEYLKDFFPVHDMAYLSGFEGSPAIELIVHNKNDFGRHNRLQSNIFISGNAHESLKTNDSSDKKILNDWMKGQSEIYEIDFKPFGINTYYSNGQKPNVAKVNCMLLKVNNFASALEFWVKVLGFQIVGEERSVDGVRWVELFFPSRVSSWQLKLLIVESFDPFPLSYLDDTGFTSLCFISTNIVRDRDCFKGLPGVSMSDIFTLKVSEKPLNICVGRGNNNELIELIQVRKNN